MGGRRSAVVQTSEQMMTERELVSGWGENEAANIKSSVTTERQRKKDFDRVASRMVHGYSPKMNLIKCSFARTN